MLKVCRDHATQKTCLCTGASIGAQAMVMLPHLSRSVHEMYMWNIIWNKGTHLCLFPMERWSYPNCQGSSKTIIRWTSVMCTQEVQESHHTTLNLHTHTLNLLPVSPTEFPKAHRHGVHVREQFDYDDVDVCTCALTLRNPTPV